MSKPASSARSGRLRASRHARYLSRAVILEEVGPPGSVRGLVILCCLLLGGFLAWASFAALSETARAPGEVVRGPSVAAVQHLEGGIVAQVHVGEGEMVEEGQLLLSMDPTAANAMRDELLGQRAALLLRRERQWAFAQDRRPNLQQGGADPAAVLKELAVWNQQQQALRDERAVVERQIQQRVNEQEGLEKRRATAVARERVLRETLGIRSNLVEKGLVSRVVYLQTLDQHRAVVGEVAELQSQLDRSGNAIGEMRNRLQQIVSTRRAEAAQEASQLDLQVAALLEQVKRVEDRIERLQVRAPVRGLVMGLGVHHAGAVVPPGGRVLDLVPADGGLVIEAKVSPRDIGHIKVGQNAQVRLSSYDHSRLGLLEGAVDKISATTFLDSARQPYYKAYLTLQQAFVGPEPGRNPVIPGMTGEVSIITGERTIMRYLLRPVVQSLSTAFTER